MIILFEYFQNYIVNQLFLATLLLITINNIWKRIDIKTPLQIIRYVLIIAGISLLIRIFLNTNLTPNQDVNSLSFINRTTGHYKWFLLFMLTSSITLPFLLLIKKIGTSKYLILTVSFIITIPYWFERFVIIVTSTHRGHMPSTWDNWLFAIYFIAFVIIPILLLFNIIIDIRKWFKKNRNPLIE